MNIGGSGVAVAAGDAAYNVKRRVPTADAATARHAPGRHHHSLIAMSHFVHSSAANRLAPPSPARGTARWLFGIAGLALAAFLLTFYVQVVQGAVTHGVQWRYANQARATVPAAQRTAPGAVETASVTP